MNEIFNPVRFWKYFTTDLKTGFTEYGSNLAGLALSGFLINLTVLIYSIATVGTEYYESVGLAGRFAFFLMALATVSISFPIKRYGIVTDRKKGAGFLLLPASVTEKFLSMIIVTTLAVPAVFSVIYLGADWLWALLDRTSDGSMIQNIHKLATIRVDSVHDPVSFFAYDDFACGILVFLLGALIFKKGKFGKTLLCTIALCTLLGLLFAILFAGKVIDNPEYFGEMILESGRIGLLDTISDTTVLVLLLAAIYWRMKKIQL